MNRDLKRSVFDALLYFPGTRLDHEHGGIVHRSMSLNSLRLTRLERREKTSGIALWHEWFVDHYDYQFIGLVERWAIGGTSWQWERKQWECRKGAR